MVWECAGGGQRMLKKEAGLYLLKISANEMRAAEKNRA
jgi:hypothetical protein